MANDTDTISILPLALLVAVCDVAEVETEVPVYDREQVNLTIYDLLYNPRNPYTEGFCADRVMLKMSNGIEEQITRSSHPEYGFPITVERIHIDEELREKMQRYERRLYNSRKLDVDHFDPVPVEHPEDLLWGSYTDGEDEW